jgi:glycine cleavage system transcriptional repressor
MSDFVVLTAVGRDRPGIVAGVAEALWRAGCNIEDTSMTLLRSEFAMIVIARRPPDLTTDALAGGLRELEQRLGLQMTLKELSAEESAHEAPSGRPYVVSVYGADRTGIVYRVTSLLAARGINVTDVNTRVLAGSQPPVYVMLIEIDLPPVVEEASLKTALAQAASELGVDVTLHPVDEEVL